MYVFVCPNGHKSFSASKEQHQPECPECGEPTEPIGDEGEAFEVRSLTDEEVEKVQQLKEEGKTETEIAEALSVPVVDLRVLKHRRQAELGKAIREEAERLFAATGKSNKEIAEELGITESRVRDILYPKQLREELIMWFPGMYEGRQDGRWAVPAADFVDKFGMPFLVAAVQKRAKEDGEWAIANGHVGQNEDLMRRMMQWVSDPKNIRQCFEANPNETLDWICRELAQASQQIAGGVRDWGGARD